MLSRMFIDVVDVASLQFSHSYTSYFARSVSFNLHHVFLSFSKYLVCVMHFVHNI